MKKMYKIFAIKFTVLIAFIYNELHVNNNSKGCE